MVGNKYHNLCILYLYLLYEKYTSQVIYIFTINVKLDLRGYIFYIRIIIYKFCLC
jgi:hypothetical protein